MALVKHYYLLIRACEGFDALHLWTEEHQKSRVVFFDIFSANLSRDLPKF